MHNTHYTVYRPTYAYTLYYNVGPTIIVRLLLRSTYAEKQA